MILVRRFPNARKINDTKREKQQDNVVVEKYK